MPITYRELALAGLTLNAVDADAKASAIEGQGTATGVYMRPSTSWSSEDVNQLVNSGSDPPSSLCSEPLDVDATDSSTLDETLLSPDGLGKVSKSLEYPADIPSWPSPTWAHAPVVIPAGMSRSSSISDVASAKDVTDELGPPVHQWQTLDVMQLSFDEEDAAPPRPNVSKAPDNLQDPKQLASFIASMGVRPRSSGPVKHFSNDDLKTLLNDLDPAVPSRGWGSIWESMSVL